MPLRPALLVYEGLPLSSGGAHRLRERRPTLVWESLSRFFRECCDDLRFQNLDLRVFDDHQNELRVAQLSEAATSVFGPPSVRRLAVSATGVTMTDLKTWPLEPRRVTEALQWAELQPPLEAAWLGPALGVTFSAQFYLKNPATGIRLPFQEPEDYGNWSYGPALLGTSAARIDLSARSMCSIDLCLPFEGATEDARAFVQSISAYLPFKLSSKHWTRMQLNKAGTGYYGRKVQVL